MKKKVLILSLIAAVVIFTVVFLLVVRSPGRARASATAGTTQTAQANQQPSVFLTYTVGEGANVEYVTIVGQVVVDKKQVVAKVSGEVKEVFVKEGDTVKVGDPLVKIDDTDYRVEYLTAYANYTTSPTEVNRLRLEQAKRNLDNTLVTSPVRGIVESVNVDPGDRVSAGTVLVTITETDTMRVEGSIDEYDLRNVREGMKAIFTFEQLGLELTGKVSKIKGSAQTSGGIVTIPVEFSFDGTPPRIVIPGLTCNVKIILTELSGSFLVPKTAVRSDEGGPYVLKRTPQGPQKVYVKIGKEINDKVEIIEGVNVGDVLVLVPSQEELQRLRTRQGLPVFGPGVPGTGGRRQ